MQQLPRIPSSRRRLLAGTALSIAVAGGIALGLAPPAARAAGTTAPLAAGASSNQVYPQAYVTHDVMLPMRDGTLLAADVYLPAEDGRKVSGQFPTLIARTPYGKSGEQTAGIFFARHGYAVVIQDSRGRFDSHGTFYPYINEAKDSYDTVEWAAQEPWSNGKVGTFGISYLAATQMLMLHDRKLPPHLVTMAPGFASASYYGDGAYVGGAFRSAHNLDYETSFAVSEDDQRHHIAPDHITPLKEVKEDVDQLYWRLPLQPFQPLLEADFPVLNDYMTHYTYDAYWSNLNNIPLYYKLDLPVLNYSGWFDLFDQGTVQNYQGERRVDDRPADASIGRPQLVMGPYIHGREAERAQGMMSGMPFLFPPNATYVDAELDLAWFDQYLKGEDVFGKMPTVRLYIPGAGFNKWIGADAFPPGQAKPTRYYIDSHGRAGAGEVSIDNLAYDGTLSRKPPSGNWPTDRYTYNPLHPVVTIEGYDQHWAGGLNEETKMYQDHRDILVYETPLLQQDVAVIGPITMTLYASTSVKTTDFMANLSDVDPTSHVAFVAEGARRGGIGDVSADPRNPESYAKLEPLVPGKVYAWKIAIWPTGHVFARGHRIRIDIASSDFPHFSRNLNTSPALTTRKVALAHQTIYHTPGYPSHVTLPIVPISVLNDMVIAGPTPPGYPKDGDAVYKAAAHSPACLGSHSPMPSGSDVVCSGF